ncbi:iron-containing alcohol dehydrogenase [Paenibacillus larvae]|uniref:Alcohol dehydrogenase GbsB n=1 Tax=Paenibacillus larvae subsp. larvae TaxID=147375 RepID=A0A2L1U2I2_9BACL|nr:iron-containing alcohol dehydrogenase [Paenibacillus larvae]AQR77252.1 alcohol dehydrogenase [Paenibacillus larvae subsp. larvae]AVF21777.1 alcohol dehydrogenase GbsB [Paenibacillus larvae subsp. larvae]AVF27145.1 alcohol dehydrogenase GbsB [Paenibacillus larvae subsp. larvae]AVF31806.1 alcohol dehydrogenase GbsB [Paenibacillus larvae subsp. larvae]ETK27529.1 alcohol dehydrogenase GbsB [Paenibacillus larvae subsp. larvae DSM 25719]
MTLNMKVETMTKLHTFEIPTVIKHGIGAVHYVGNEAKTLGITKVLLVTDPGIYNAGVVNPVVESLQKAGIQVILFQKVEPNPPVRLVAEGSKLYAEEGCNGLVAVGGGSSMDTAKAIGVEVVHEGSVLDYEAAEGKKPLVNRIPPLVTIPTTAGTGSEVTQWAVITDEERKYKFNTGGPLIAAHLTIIDPELHISMPPHVTAMTGVDALAHAIECYTMKFAQPITDAVALLAIEYGAHYIRRAFADGQDLEARYGMAQAAMLAGLSYGSESAGAAHAMSQTLGGIIPVAHGQCVAAMMGPVMEYNWKGYPEKFARIAKAFGIDTNGMTVEEAAKDSVNWMYELVEDLEIPNLEEQGVSPDMIDRLSKEAMKDPQTVGNPRDLNEKAYNWIYKRCFNLIPKTV